MEAHSNWPLQLLGLVLLLCTSLGNAQQLAQVSNAQQPPLQSTIAEEPLAGTTQELYKWLSAFRQAQALNETVTKAFWCLADGFSSGSKERRVFSQFGEDGVIEFIAGCIGTTDKYYVEFGTQDGSECTTRYLREQKGWKGLLMDGGFENASINLHREFMTAENIAALFIKYNVPHPSFDHLTVDIDLNTPYVLRAILAAGYRPRQVAVEYNRNHHPKHAYMVMYSPSEMFKGGCYYGGSALAIERIAKAFGYSLVAFDSEGVNLFFVRDDILGMPFPHSFADLTFADKWAFHGLHGDCQQMFWMYVQDTERLAHSDWIAHLHPVMLSHKQQGKWRIFSESESVWFLKAIDCAELVMPEGGTIQGVPSSKGGMLGAPERRQKLCHLQKVHKAQRMSANN